MSHRDILCHDWYRRKEVIRHRDVATLRGIHLGGTKTERIVWRLATRPCCGGWTHRLLSALGWALRGVVFATIDGAMHKTEVTSAPTTRSRAGRRSVNCCNMRYSPYSRIQSTLTIATVPHGDDDSRSPRRKGHRRTPNRNDVQMTQPVQLQSKMAT